MTNPSAAEVVTMTYTVGFSPNPVTFPIEPPATDTIVPPNQTLEMTIKLSSEASAIGVSFATPPVTWLGALPAGVNVVVDGADIKIRQTNSLGLNQGNLAFDFVINLSYKGEIFTTQDPTIVNQGTGG